MSAPFIIHTERAKVRNLLAGLRLGGDPSGVAVQVQGDCTAPVELFLRGKPDLATVRLGLEPESDLVASLWVRCRKCDACLLHRARLWTARGIDETKAARRTWFGTLTFAPIWATKHRYASELRASRRGHALDQMTDAERFAYFASETGVEVTKWLKRTRKNTGARLRYLLTCEAHKSGVPHYHVLLHETSEVAATKRALEAAWKQGFSHWRLVQPGEGAAAYACKYLAKSALTRVRASQHYGSVKADHLAERIEEALASILGRERRNEETDGDNRL